MNDFHRKSPEERATELGRGEVVSLLLNQSRRIFWVKDFGDPVAPGLVTLTLGRPAQSGVTPAEPVTCDYRAAVAFGQGGSTEYVVCDWARGAQLSFVATAVEVTAIPYQPIADVEFAPQRAGLYAQLGSMTRPSGVNPVYSVPFYLGTGSLPVDFLTVAPAFARAVRVLAAPDVPGGGDGYSGQLRLELGAGPAVLASRLVTSPDAVPLPSAMPTAVRIRNASALQNFRGVLQFDLAV